MATGRAGEELPASATPTPGDGVPVGEGVARIGGEDADAVATAGGTARWVAGGGDRATGLDDGGAMLVGFGVGARVGREVGRGVDDGVGGGVAGLVTVMRPCISAYPWMVQ